MAEPSVALVDGVVDRKGTRGVAQAYLEYLYTPEGQDIVARNFFRPRNTGILETYAERFPQVRMFTIDDAFGGWREAQTRHFNDGGIYDRIFVAESAAPPAALARRDLTSGAILRRGRKLWQRLEGG